MGGDRELVLCSALLAFVLTIPSFDWVAITSGVLLWVIALFLLRQMGKADPLMRQVYLRHRQYQKHYPARSTPFRINRHNHTTAFSRSKK
jgi:type IV secretion system protein TrbD